MSSIEVWCEEVLSRILRATSMLYNVNNIIMNIFNFDNNYGYQLPTEYPHKLNKMTTSFICTMKVKVEELLDCRGLHLILIFFHNFSYQET